MIINTCPLNKHIAIASQPVSDQIKVPFSSGRSNISYDALSVRLLVYRS